MNKKLQSLLFVCALLSVNIVTAQWQQTSINIAGSNNCIATNGNNIFAGQSTAGSYSFVYYSPDNGATSVKKTDQFQSVIHVNGGSIYKSGGGDYLSISTDNGTSWTPYTTLDGAVISSYLLSILVNGTTILVGTSGNGIARSTDNGATWSLSNSGLTPTAVKTLAISGSTIFAGAGTGIYISNDNGSSWTSSKAGIDTRVLSVSGANVYAATYGFGVFVSSDKGLSWTAVNNGLPNNFVTAFCASGNHLFAGPVNSSAYYSNDNGQKWISIGAGLPTPAGIGAFAVNSTTVFAGIVNSADTSGIWSRPLSDNFTGITENSKNLGFAIYPNPVKNELNIETFNTGNKETIEIIDITGKCRYSAVNRVIKVIDVSTLAPGIYILKLTSGSTIRAKRFVKE